MTKSQDMDKGRFPWSAPPLRMALLLGSVGLVGLLAGVLTFAILSDGQSGSGGDELTGAVDALPTGSAASADSDGPGEEFRVQFWTASLFPVFHPDRRRYVTRCGPGGVRVRVNAFRGAEVAVEGNKPATGRFEVEARPAPGQDFRVTVSGGGNDLNGAYTIRCLPTAFPGWEYSRFRKPPEGLFTVAFRPRPADRNRAWIITFDQGGVPRWWHSPNLNALWAAILPNGTLGWARGFGDGFGQDSRAAIEISDLQGRRLELARVEGIPNDSHEFVRLENGNTLVMGYRPRFGVDLSEFGLGETEGVLDSEIQEVTPQGEVVWRWNSKDHIDLDETPARWWQRVRANPHPDPGGRDRYDILHLNSIEPVGDDLLILSTRHSDAVFAISRKSGEVVWKFGGTETDQSLQLKGPDPYRDDPLNGAHDARFRRGILTVYDNGTLADRAPRVVRYRIDADAGTATFLSQIDPPSEVTRSYCCGSARRFGGGWLVSWGGNKLVTGYNRAGALAFRVELADPSYRAVPVPASVKPSILEQALEEGEEPGEPPGKATEPVLRLSPEGEVLSGN